MCLHCLEHNADKIWYLNPQSHTSSGGMVDFVDRIMYPSIVLPGLRQLKDRQPYGTERWTGVSKFLMNWLTSAIHGYQVVPDVESAHAVVDLANQVVLSICSCRTELHGQSIEDPTVWKCIGLNNAARITIRDNAQPFKVISKERAKEIISEQRARGCLQSVGWRLGPQVNWMCNCDEACSCHRVPELEWAMIPSIVVSNLIRPENCDGCRACLEACHRRGAITFDEQNRPVIDQSLCWGCGLCIEACPTSALEFVPRERIYDVMTRKVVTVPGGVVAV